MTREDGDVIFMVSLIALASALFALMLVFAGCSREIDHFEPGDICVPGSSGIADAGPLECEGACALTQGGEWRCHDVFTLKPSGAACATNDECMSGVCIDGECPVTCLPSFDLCEGYLPGTECEPSVPAWFGVCEPARL